MVNGKKTEERKKLTNFGVKSCLFSDLEFLQEKEGKRPTNFVENHVWSMTRKCSKKKKMMKKKNTTNFVVKSCLINDQELL